MAGLRVVFSRVRKSIFQKSADFWKSGHPAHFLGPKKWQDFPRLREVRASRTFCEIFISLFCVFLHACGSLTFSSLDLEKGPRVANFQVRSWKSDWGCRHFLAIFAKFSGLGFGPTDKPFQDQDVKSRIQGFGGGYLLAILVIL